MKARALPAVLVAALPHEARHVTNLHGPSPRKSRDALAGFIRETDRR